MNLSRLAKTVVVCGLGAGALAVLGWLLARLLKEEEDSEAAAWVSTVPAAPERTEFEVPLDEEVPVAGQVDDFTRITGIGPRYAEGLIALGITSFRALSEQDGAELADGLHSQGLRITGDRIAQDDWIGQARRLMAEG